MIAGVRGRVKRVEASAVVLELGPVDVRVAIPTRVGAELAPGADLALCTHLYVREDQIALFGFKSEEELEIFELLLSVSGVGPRLAMGLLSTLDADQVAEAILHGQPQVLTRAPGVGARAAAKIIAELQGRVPVRARPVVAENGSLRNGALTALVGMGYAPAEAKRAVDSVADEESVEGLLRAALGFLADR